MPLVTSPLRKLFLRRLFSVSLPKLQPALGLDVARPGPKLTELSLDIPSLPRLKPTFDNLTLPSLHNTRGRFAFEHLYSLRPTGRNLVADRWVARRSTPRP